MSAVFIAHANTGAQHMGGVDLLDRALASVRRHDTQILTGGMEDALAEAKRRRPGDLIVHIQQEGGLSRRYRDWAMTLLDKGTTVLEKNVFALGSPWRPRHPRYRMIVYSRDGLYRYRLRSAATRGHPVERAVHVPGPLTQDLRVSSAPALREEFTVGDPDALVLLRIGRPDPRKWTTFELDFADALARAMPDRRVALALVGVPVTIAPQHPPPSNLSVVRLGYTPDVGQAYAAADTYVHHSRIGETFGLTLYEAALAGLPAVAGMDVAWDCAPVEFLDTQHTVTTPRRALELAKRGSIPSNRVRPPPLTDPSAYLGSLLEFGAADAWNAIPRVPSRTDALAHLRSLGRRLNASPSEVGLSVARELARAARRGATIRAQV